MKYSIAIVEDSLEYQSLISEYLERYKTENNIQFQIHLFKDGDEITDDYEAIYDLIFFDIEMSRMDGMTAAKKIREYDQEVIIIFITNMAQYAISGYAVNAMNFILKPINYFAFSQELNKSLERVIKRKEKFIALPVENGMIRLNVSDIKYIESIKHYLYIHTNNEEYTIRSTMKRMEEILKDSSFFRCNNSYLVNLSKVDAVNGEYIIIGQDELKISRPRKKDFMEALATYLGSIA